MTNKEAIKILDNLKPGDYRNPYEKGEAIVMAISALQAQEAKTQLSAEGTTSDLISRQDAIEVIEEMQMPIMRSMFPEEQFVFKGMSEALSAIKDLPSAQPEIEERTEEFAQNVPKEDLISRKAAIDGVKTLHEVAWKNWHEPTLSSNTVIDMIKDLPPAQPETAKRIVGKSRNGMTLWYQCDMCNEPVDAQDNFCRGCGRRLTDG